MRDTLPRNRYSITEMTYLLIDRQSCSEKGLTWRKNTAEPKPAMLTGEESDKSFPVIKEEIE